MGSGKRRGGPPPRAWGQLRHRAAGGGVHRSTPTRVGTTPAPSWSCLLTAGPPPRAWGQPTTRPPQRARSRSTPTRVGTTQLDPAGRVPPAVHPHARGDNALSRGCLSRFDGPPPRAWGQPHRPQPDSDGVRSTPTRVGTTGFAVTRGSGWPVHPHARGDNHVGLRRVGAVAGPPPRAWGQHPDAAAGILDSRSTPTRVGTTPRAYRTARKTPVHPHARGDNSSGSTSQPSPTAVHPHARGDNSVPPRPTGRPGTVHPHARGDNAAGALSRPEDCGPPPRAWGQRIILAGVIAPQRSTPTRVGTT